MITPTDQKTLRKKFDRDLTSRVRLDLFTQKPTRMFLPGQQECPFCEDAKTLLEEIAALSTNVAYYERLAYEKNSNSISPKMAEEA